MFSCVNIKVVQRSRCGSENLMDFLISLFKENVYFLQD